MKKILIIQKRVGIGDFCVFLPTINEIAKFFNNYQIDVLTQKRTQAKEFISEHKYINEIFYVPDNDIFKESAWIFNHIRNSNYEKCFIFHYGFRYYLLSKLAGVNNVFSYGIFKKNENIVEKSRNFINSKLNIKNTNFDFKINFNGNFEKKEQITFGIGGSGKDKKWDIKYFIELGILLNKRKSFKILIAGGKNETEDADYITKHLKTKNIETISLCNFDIKSTLPFLASSKFYVGNDTGFMHLSGCLGIKSFGLFGRTSINYCSYNGNIFPISLPKEQQMNISRSDAINFIKPGYVLNFLVSSGF
tara:strand:+ start:1122 stop:2039 length:918 start_codon:yes stop_codon:yes gene_type:complete